MKNWKIGSLVIVAAALTLGASNINHRPDDDEWKNLKILPKNISEKALDSVMTDFTIALGVRCGFCHARVADTNVKKLDFASDAKDEKNIARHMMKMVSYLNTNDFNFNNSTKPDTIHEIICYTCHRGKKDPGSDMLMPEINRIKAEMMRKRDSIMKARRMNKDK